MSDYTKLIINGIEADFFKGEDLPLNIKNRISNDEGEPAGSFTRSTLRLPATKTNKSILDGQKGFLPFSIEENGAVKISGNLQLKGADLVNDGYKGVKRIYRVNLIGGSADWFTLLRGCKLSDLTDAQTIFNLANVQAGFNANPNADAFGFTLVKWHEWQNSKIVQEENTTGTFDRLMETPSFEESTPFFFLHYFINAAFNSVGYTIQSNFLNSEYFRRLIMLVPLPQKMPEEYSEQFLNFYAELALHNVLTTDPVQTLIPFDTVTEPPQNPGVWNALTFQYTAPETGYYEVEIGATYGPEVGLFNFIYARFVTVNGLQVAPGVAGWGDGALFGLSTFPTSETRRASYVFFVNKGDTIEVTQLSNTTQDFTMINNYMKITGEAIKTAGLKIDFKSLLKRYDCLEMIKDVFNIFNLKADTNPENKTVLIEPADGYRYTERLTATDEQREGYYFNYQNIDYTQKVDYKKKPQEKYNKLEGILKYIYQSDDEETAETVESNEEFVIYEGQFLPGNGADLSKTKTIETEFFAKTIHVFDEFARYTNTPLAPQFPLIYPNDYVFDPTATPNDADYDVLPRLLWFAGQRGGLDGYIELFESGQQTELPAAFMVNYNDVTGLDPNLSFCSEVINGVPVPGMLQNFHLNNLERKSQREELKANVLINSVERDNFSFRNRAIIDEKRYIIQETETVNPLQRQPAIFKFILDRFADQNTVNKLVSSPLRGVVSLFR